MKLIPTLLFCITAYSYAANGPSGRYYHLATSREDARRLEMIEDLHEQPCIFLPPDYAYLCCANAESKLMLKNIYPEGGVWDDPNANRCKKCLVACRRRGCGVEHLLSSLSCAAAAAEVAIPLTSKQTCDFVTAALPVAFAGLGCLEFIFYHFTTKGIDQWLSDPKNWSYTPTHMTEDTDEREEMMAYNRSDSSSEE